MPRIADYQPKLFPVGDMGPPDAPVRTAVACADGDDGWEAIMVAVAWLMVRAYAHAKMAQEESSRLS